MPQEIGCTSWAQVFLKFIVSHPAVTCVIPATSRPEHMQDNLQAGFGPMPDAAMRERMAKDFDGQYVEPTSEPRSVLRVSFADLRIRLKRAK